MLVLFFIAYTWFPQIKALAQIFRDPTKPVADDGVYGGIMGVVISAYMSPSLMLPLLVVHWIHRRLGFSCPQCGVPLTLWRRSDQGLNGGHCGKCGASVFSQESEVMSRPN
jgi:hypothetical protein